MACGAGRVSVQKSSTYQAEGSERLGGAGATPQQGHMQAELASDLFVNVHLRVPAGGMGHNGHRAHMVAVGRRKHAAQCDPDRAAAAE